MCGSHETNQLRGETGVLRFHLKLQPGRYNSVSGESRYEDSTAPQEDTVQVGAQNDVESAAVPLPDGYTQSWDEASQAYFYVHTITGESTWEYPGAGGHAERPSSKVCFTHESNAYIPTFH